MTKNYTINTRNYTFLSTINEALNLKDNRNYLFDLSYLSVVNVIGDNAFNFLQGQLSCDIREITLKTMRPGALCNLKGRIMALLDVIYTNHYQFIIASDLIEETLLSLNKVALLSRVKLQAVNLYKIYGFYLNNSADLLPKGIELPTEQYSAKLIGTNYCYALGENLYLIICLQTDSDAIIQPFTEKQQFLGSLSWHHLQILNKQMQIYPNTRGLFLPHRLNLQLTPAISFDKGCYKGQEIIARTHYRAKLKHRLDLFKIKSLLPIAAGQKLFDSLRQQEIGEIIDYCPLAESNDYLLIASVLKDYPKDVIIEGQEDIICLELFEKAIYAKNLM